ncbi:MAG: hypothetical protein L0322_06660 [Chloroflexi bacterium]|nr:hypothetical protein [Chloroflexota bacterium]MCI0580423.1 hypothetical protein [Chloroflexota bacterium]MCI0649951.1 hypothetical protein [Chloroflexota bacterium]
MNRSDSWKTWGLIIALLLISGLASAAWPFISARLSGEDGRRTEAVEEEIEPITIQVKDYVLGSDLLKIPFISENIDGRQLDPFLALGLVTALVVGGLVAMGLPLGFLYVMLDRAAKRVKSEESYQTAVTTLKKQESENLKQIRREQPADPKPEAPVMPRWSVVSTSLIILLFVLFLAFAFAPSFGLVEEMEQSDRLISPVRIASWVLMGLTLIVLFFVFRGRSRQLAVDDAESDDRPVPWGWVWVVVSGVLIVGLGTGLAIALRSMPAG